MSRPDLPASRPARLDALFAGPAAAVALAVLCNCLWGAAFPFIKLGYRLYAIGSGGIFGRGLGSSLQKLGFVPEAQNDMIFSIICEETGLVGASLVILVFALLIWRLMVNAVHAPDLLGELICTGIMGHLAIQVILNIAVVTNTIPNTGITLPFVSYGGTSVLFLMGEMGLALSVSRSAAGKRK